MILSEKKVHTDKFGGCIDILTGIEDFDTPDLTYNETWHTYRYKGKIIPSVTQLLDDGTYVGIPEDILESARLRGTLIHKEIEDYLKRGLKGYTDEATKFIEYYQENKEKFEEKAIWDIKTYTTATKKNREKCYKQIKMYAEAIEYLTGIKITKKYLIHLPKNKGIKIYDLEEEFDGTGDVDSDKGI